MFKIHIDDQIDLFLATPIYAEAIFGLIEDNREHLSEWLAWPAVTNHLSDCIKSAKRSLHDYADGKSMQCYIKFEGEFVGVVSFNDINHSLKRVEIGYWLASSDQGKGIITRSCSKLIELAFNNLAIEKVQISVAEGNVKSRAICEKLCMVIEGIITNAENVNGRIVNHVIYSLRKG